jgi:DNA-binding PadR family transcriptional regulator
MTTSEIKSALPLVLPRDFISPCLLLLLAERPAYGYQLLDELSHWGLSKDTGSIYRALHELENAHLIRSEMEPSDSGPPRRRYHLAPHGQEQLWEWCERLANLQRVLDEFIVHFWSTVGRGIIEFRSSPDVTVGEDASPAAPGGDQG